VAEFEGDTGGAEVGEFGAAFRVDEGVAVGACVREGLVVIDDDDIDALGAKHGDFVDGDGAAIDGDEEVGFRALVHAAFEGCDAEAVSLGAAAGDEVAWFEAIGAEDPPHEGDRGDSIDVVIAVDTYTFLTISGEEEAFDGFAHAGDEEWIGEVAEAWIEETFEVGAGRDASLEDEVFEDGRNGARRTISMSLKRFAAWNPAEWQGSHEVDGG